MDHKHFIGAITIVLAVLSYTIYIRRILKHQARPHAFSWLIWALLNGFIFFIQQDRGAAAGGWITGFSALAALVIFSLCLAYSKHDITRLDWYCMLGAALSLYAWYLNRESVSAIIFACLTFIAGFIPTFRKSYRKPRQEPAISFTLNGTKFTLALFALGTLNFSTLIYPLTVAILNFGFVAILLIRRAQLPLKHKRI